MKRSFSQVGKGGSTPTTPGMKRASSDGSATPSLVVGGGDESGGNVFLLSHQNRELMLELKNKKRNIADLRTQLSHQKKQAAEAQELLSVLDRSYNQFNDDISRMISILTSQQQQTHESNNSSSAFPTTATSNRSSDAKAKEWLSLIQSYLEAGEVYFNMTPVHEMGMIKEEDEGSDNSNDEPSYVNMLRLRSDDWTNENEIEELRQDALKRLEEEKKTTQAAGGSGRDRNTTDKEDSAALTMSIDDDEEEVRGNPSSRSAFSSSGTCHDRVKTVNSELSQRTRSIKAKLHTLLKALETKMCASSSLSSSQHIAAPAITHSMIQTRQLRAEKLLLTELVAKYKAEIINLQAEVKCGERRLSRLQRIKYFSSQDKVNSKTSSEGSWTESSNQTHAHQTQHYADSASSLPLPDRIERTAINGSVRLNIESKTNTSIDSNHSFPHSDQQTFSDNNHNTVALETHERLTAELHVVRQRQIDAELLVSILKEQLQDTEKLRSEAEHSLSEYIYITAASNPLTLISSSENSNSNSCNGGSSTDIGKMLSPAQRLDLEKRWSREAEEIENTRHLLQETRQEHFKKLNDIEMEKNHFSRRISELELALSVLTNATASRISEVSGEALSQVESMRREKDAAESALRSLQQETKMFELTKTRLAELEIIESSHQKQCSFLSDRIKAQNTSAEITTQNLQASREREAKLESKLASFALEKEQKIRQLALQFGLKELQSEAEEGMIPEVGDVDINQYPVVKEAKQECHQMLTNLLTTAQTRIGEITTELQDTKNNMNDLILEIESVANEEEQTREHNSRLVKQLGEIQAVQKNVMMENLRLHQDIQSLQESGVDLKEKVTHMKAYTKQQDELLDILKTTEHKLRLEIHNLNGNLIAANNNIESHIKSLAEAEFRCTQAESATVECRRKMVDLKSRCQELSKQYEAERKKRLEVERHLQNVQAENIRLSEENRKNSLSIATVTAVPNASNASKLSGDLHEESEGSQMLDLTLTMLRCSVCRDRFKEVAITRCFHLFCKPCIDLNLSSRHRKCPACGERFGQDDVKAVYFTH